MRPLFYSDQDCRDRLKPGKPMFFNVYVNVAGRLWTSRGTVDVDSANFLAWGVNQKAPPYRIVVKAKPNPSPEKEDAA